MERQHAIWSRQFILALLAALFTGLCLSMFDSTLSLLASDVWNSNVLGGYLTSCFTAGSIAMAFFSGRLVAQWGRRICFIAASLLFSVSTLAAAVWMCPTVTLAVRVVQGMAKSLAMIAGASIIADIVPKERLGEGMGYYNLGQTAARAFGPSIGLAITAGGRYAPLFIVGAFAYLAAAGLTVGVNYEKRSRIAAAEAVPINTTSETTNERGVWRFLERRAVMASLNYALFFFSTGVILVFLVVYARQVLAMQALQTSLFFILSTIATILVRIRYAKLSDQRGALAALVPGHAALLLSLLLLCFFSENCAPVFLLSGVLYGVGNALVMPTLNAEAIISAPHKRSDVANATFFFMMDAGMLLSATLIGNLVDHASTLRAGYQNAFFLCMAAATASMLLSLLHFKRNK